MIKEFIKKAYKEICDCLKQAFFPKMCVTCGRFLDEDGWICNLCSDKLERVNSEKRCLKCGHERSNCSCKYNVYHFESIIAPFYNAGLMQRAIYRYKIAPQKGYADYFAAEMTKSVLCEYYGIKFDAVCFVPTKQKTVNEKGFDHSGFLAKKISENLNVPLRDDILYCSYKGEKLHNLNAQERFEKIRGRYGFKNRLKNENVLLVDDIATTGASLDECARQLLFAGAESVRCVTAVITDRKFKPDEYSERVKMMLINP